MDEEIFGTDAEDMTEDGAKITDEEASPENNPEDTANGVLPDEDGAETPADEDPDEAPIEEENNGNVDPLEEEDGEPSIFIFPGDDESLDESVSPDLITDNFGDGLDGSLEDDFPDEVSADEVSADEGSADKLEPEPEPEQKTEQKPEQESQPEESTEERTEEQPEEQPEEQAKKKLWDTLKEAFSKFTIRSKTEKDVEAEIVESQNQGLKPVSKEKQSEEKQLSPEEIMKIDACTAIMMAHLEKYNIPYDSQTVKGIVQTALTGYAVALGSDRPLGDLRDANTTKRLISDVMNGITNDIQNRFGDQPIKVTTTVSFGKDEVRTIAKQMANILRIHNDDHLGHSIRTTLDEIPNIKVPLTVSYMEALEERKKHETIIENNNTYISDLKKAIEDQKTSLNDIKEKFKAETGLDYDEITAFKAPNTPDTPDYSKILRPEYSELFEQCALLSSNLNGLNKSLEDQGRVDLPNINNDDEKIHDMEERLQNSGVPDITGFINELNPIAVSSEEIPAPENSPSSTLEEVLADVGKKEKVPDEQPKADDATEQPAPDDAVTPDASADATPSDPTPEAAAEESASPAVEPAPATEESASAAVEPAPATEESASAAVEPAPAAENQGQGQDDAETASATAEQLKVNDNAQSEEKSDSDDLESAPATPPTDDQDQNSEKPADATTPESDENHKNKKPNTMFGPDGGKPNTAGSEAAAEEKKKATASTETNAATTVIGQGKEHTRKTGGFGRGGNK